jgi:hypothetical protein
VEVMLIVWMAVAGKAMDHVVLQVAVVLERPAPQVRKHQYRKILDQGFLYFSCLIARFITIDIKNLAIRVPLEGAGRSSVWGITNRTFIPFN